MTSLPSHLGSWIVIDSGRKLGLDHMQIDIDALSKMLLDPTEKPRLRFFQWLEPAVSYGYLLDATTVQAWAKENGGHAIVKRPTGGGAVCHTTKDLSLSLLWPRTFQALSAHPRECYAQIHTALQKGLTAYFGTRRFELHAPKSRVTCSDGALTGAAHFSACFQEPVCNDVMRGSKKIIGGALRVTKQAILYQGTIKLDEIVNLKALQLHLLQAFEPLLAPQPNMAGVR